MSRRSLSAEWQTVISALFGVLVFLLSPRTVSAQLLDPASSPTPSASPVLAPTDLSVAAPVVIPEKLSLPSARIRSIQIRVRDMFEGDDLAAPYKWANAAKISTREEIVRRELLFKEGDPYDQFVVDESARSLRTLPFLRQIEILPKFDGDAVDLLVSVQDTWTLIPQIGLQSGGGQNRTAFGLAEGNLFGFGKRAEILLADDAGRKSAEAVWDDRRFLGTKQRLLLGHFDRSDGFHSLALWSRPFRSLLDKDSWQTYVDVSDTVGKLWEFGDERYIFRTKHEQIGGSYTIAAGDPEERLRRSTVGYEYLLDSFVDADAGDFEDVDVDPNAVSQDPNLLAEDRKFSGPFVMFEQIYPDYISSNWIDRFERVEDYNLGNEFSARLQLASHALGSLNDTGLLSLGDRWGYRLGDKHFMRFEVGASTRGDNFGFDNNYVRAEGKYYYVLGPKYLWGFFVGQHTLASSMSLDYGADLDKDRELLLGAENGLRGYEDRTFAGSRRFLWNIEDRIHVFEDVFQLFNIGFVTFADFGGTTRDELGRIFSNGFYSDAGVGMRIGFPRSQGGSMVRIDLAFPLRDGPQDDVDQGMSPRIFISTGQVFSARLRAESLGLDKANVTITPDR